MESYTLLVGMQNGTAAIESSIMIPQTTKIKTMYDPVIPLLTIQKN